MNLTLKPRRQLVFTLLLWSVLCTCGSAQEIRLSVIVPNPPPIYWESYLEFDADIRVIATNIGTEVRQLKLIPTLSSDRGLSAAFRPGYQPLSPLTLSPGETVTLTYRELNALFGTPTQDDILLEGIDFDRLFASETIPEGSYSLCVEARDFATNEPLSNNFGCDLFFVQQHEPPLIIWPFDQESVTAQEPQFLNFLWSATGIPGQTHYRFALFDLDELGLNNRSDAFLLSATRPLYEVDNLVTTNLVYDLASPPLTPGRHYAVQVTAYDPAGNLLFAQGGQSVVHQFLYSEGLSIINTGGVLVNTEGSNGNGVNNDGPGQFQNDSPGQQLAMQACAEQLPGVPIPYPTTLTTGQTVTVAGFDLILNTGGPTPLAGNGRILVESLNTFVNVSFTGLEVNQSDEVVGDNVSIAAISSGNPDLDNLSEATALQLADQVDQGGNWLSPGGGAPGPALNLPVGIAGGGMDLIVTGMNFGPGSASLDLFAKVELPEAQGNRRLLLIGKGACLNDDNLGQDMDLLLADDITYALSPGVSMTFAGGEEGTRLQWNENGIEELVVDFTMAFSEDLMPEGNPFAARITATVTDYQDWIGSVELDPENTLAEAGENLSFNYGKTEWVYDHSSSENPAGLSLPASHPDAGQPDLWQGLYLSEFDVLFPEGFDITLAAEDLLLDAQGLWTMLNLNGELLSIDEGSLGGWAVGVDGLELDIRASSFYAASFDGRIKLPIGDTEVSFTAPLDNDEDFTFALDLGQELEVDMWLAEIELDGNSKLIFSKVGNGFIPETNLHGSISLGWGGDTEEEGLSVGQFGLPGFNFQNFNIVGGDNPSVSGEFGLDLEGVDQGSMQNIPLQINDVVLELAPNNIDIGLQFDLGLKFTNSANGFDGNTVFTIFGRRVNGQYSYDHTQLNAVSIEAELNLVSLYGELEVYEGDDLYGDGFAAAIGMNIANIGAGFDVRLQVGRAPGGYRYFMTDALLMLPDPGIQLGSTPFSIYGFGGGLWRNMERESNIGQFITYDPNNLAPQAQGNDDPGSSATFTPTEGNFGFSMTLVTGISGSQRAVNADLEFTMTIGEDFSVDEITLGGGVYVVQPMSDRSSAFISGTGELKLDFDDQIFTLTVEGGMDFSLPKAVDVDVSAPLYAGFSTGGGVDWWFWLGQWTDGVEPQDDDNRVSIKTGIDFGFASLESTQNLYFVMGNVWPQGQPGVPSVVNQTFAEDGKSVPQQNLPPNTTQKGFAFGMARSMDLDFNARIFQLEVGWLWGFDLALRDLDGVCDADDFGINGWYADGKAYAHMHIAGSVKGRLFGKTRTFKFLELDAAARLDFAGPNPIWIKGTARLHGRALGKLIKFDTNVSFEFGEKVDCRDSDGGIFDEIPIVEQLDPDDLATGRSIFTAPQASFNFPNHPLEIEEDDGQVNYYGYRKVYCKVSTRKKKSDGWQVLHADLDASYDTEGYAAFFDPGALPPEHWVKVELRVQGLRYDGPNGGVDKLFLPMQDEVIEFKTGLAPDRLLKGSISSTIPFRRQLYFTPGDHPTGRIDFGATQSPHLFRDKPDQNDKLDPDGTFEYVVRFTSLASGMSRDAPVTSVDPEDGISFNMPANGFAANTIYKADLLRLYYPPAGTEEANTEVALVNLNLYTPPELGIAAVTPAGNNDDDDDDGGGIIGNLQISFANQGQPGSPPNGINGYQFAGNQQQQTNGISQTASYTTEQLPPGPDPPFEPEMGLMGNGGNDDDGGWGIGGAILQEPGGSNGTLERESRELKSRGRTSATVEKSLWPKNQQTWYFRTSKFTTLNQKIAAVTNPVGSQNRSYPTAILTDDNYEEVKESIHLPYIIVRSKEPFDRYETKYRQQSFAVWDDEQHLPHKDFDQKFYPAVDISGAQSQWRQHVFYDKSYGNDGGLFDRPFQSDFGWCTENFLAVEGQEIGSSVRPGGGDHAPLHEEGSFMWQDYLQFGGYAYSVLNSETRFGSVEPFGRNAYQRRFATADNNYDYESPTVEFVQWGPNGEGLGGSGVTDNRKILSQAQIDAVQPIDLTGGIGEITLDASPGPDLLPAQQEYKVALIDYTEWVTFQDYIQMRKALADGIEELRDNFGPDGSVFPEHTLSDCNVNCNNCDPAHLGDLTGNSLNGGRSFYHFYYRQIRSYLDKPIGANTYTYFPYPVRPPGEYSFILGSKPIQFQLPAVNHQTPEK